MHRLLTVILLSLALSGCIHIYEDFYFEPSGPGTVWGSTNVATSLSIPLSSNSSLWLYATQNDGSTAVTIIASIGTNDTVQLSAATMPLKCRDQSAKVMQLPHWQVQRIVNGIGRWAYLGSTDTLVGRNYDKVVPRVGEVVTGEYRLDIVFSSCADPTFEIVLPALSVTGVSRQLSPITFTLKYGRIVRVGP